MEAYECTHVLTYTHFLILSIHIIFKFYLYINIYHHKHARCLLGAENAHFIYLILILCTYSHNTQAYTAEYFHMRLSVSCCKGQTGKPKYFPFTFK